MWGSVYVTKLVTCPGCPPPMHPNRRDRLQKTYDPERDVVRLENRWMDGDSLSLKSNSCPDVPVDAIDAPAAVQTGRACAFINVDLAVLALETGRALAGVHGDVVNADATILTGVELTLVDLHRTVNPCGGVTVNIRI